MAGDCPFKLYIIYLLPNHSYALYLFTYRLCREEKMRDNKYYNKNVSGYDTKSDIKKHIEHQKCFYFSTKKNGYKAVLFYPIRMKFSGQLFINYTYFFAHC